MNFSLAKHVGYVEVIQEEFDKVGQDFNKPGLFVQAYRILAALISKDAGSEILTVKLNSDGTPEKDSNGIILLDRNGNPIDRETWKPIGNVSNWVSKPGVDPGAWVFLNGVAPVNNNDRSNAYARFIRDYTHAQYKIRFGVSASVGSVNNASNRIANAILSDILDPSNPTHILPDIRQIASNDAESAAEALFNRGQIAGWAGNPFLVPVGYTDAFYENILNDEPGNPYDLLSVIKASYIAGFESEVTDRFDYLHELLTDTLGIEFDVPGAPTSTSELILDIIGFTFQAYGSYSTTTQLTTYPEILLGRGRQEMDELVASEASEFIHGGDGNDVIIGSLMPGLLEIDRDIVDGGDGHDILDLSHKEKNLDVESGDQGHTGFNLELILIFLNFLHSARYTHTILSI